MCVTQSQSLRVSHVKGRATVERDPETWNWGTWLVSVEADHQEAPRPSEHPFLVKVVCSPVSGVWCSIAGGLRHCPT